MRSFQKNFFLFLICLFHALYIDAQVTLDDPLLKIPQLQPNEKPGDLIARNIFIQVQSSSNSVFTGEPVLVTYKLFTALNSQSRVTQQPSFSGCSVLELPIDKEPDEEVIQGKKYHVFTIRKVLLIPLQAGELILGKAEVDNIVAITKTENLMDAQNYHTSTSNNLQTLLVKALPADGKPTNFQMLVGNYSMSASVQKDTFQVGENATLKITISGQGNIRGIPSPFIQWPENTEHFDGSDTQQADLYSFPIKGFKQFEIPFIGKKIGQTFIPPIQLYFFDPVTVSYKKVQTDSIPIIFTKAISPLTPSNEKDKTSLSNIPYLVLIPIILLIIFLVILIPVWMQKKKLQNDRAIVNEKKPVEALPENLYVRLNKLAGIEKDKDYFLAIKSLLVVALQAMTGMESTLEYSLISALEKIPGEMENAIKSKMIFDTCNRQLFAQEENNHLREEVYFEMASLLKSFDLKKATFTQ